MDLELRFFFVKLFSRSETNFQTEEINALYCFGNHAIHELSIKLGIQLLILTHKEKAKYYSTNVYFFFVLPETVSTLSAIYLNVLQHLLHSLNAMLFVHCISAIVKINMTHHIVLINVFPPRFNQRGSIQDNTTICHFYMLLDNLIK